MKHKLLLLIAICLSTAAMAQKKDSTYFESTEDTVWIGKKIIQVTHVDWKCTHNPTPPHVDKNGRINEIWIYGSGVEWYRFTKRFILTDTGWKRL